MIQQRPKETALGGKGGIESKGGQKKKTQKAEVPCGRNFLPQSDGHQRMRNSNKPVGAETGK